MIYKQGLEKILHNIPLVALFIYCLGREFVLSFPLLGIWESSTILHTFAPEEIWLNTLIQPRANIGGYEYALLDLSRHVSSLFGFNLFSIRLLPIVSGFISLVLFYQLLKKWCNKNTAILVTAILASNPIFIAFQHLLNVSIISFTSFIFCIFAFLFVDREKVSSKSIWIFAFACAVASLHYQIVRYCMLAIVFFWMTRGFHYNRGAYFENLWLFDKENRKNYTRFLVALIVCLTLLHPFNIFSFFSPSLLTPNNGEYARSFQQLIENVKVNLPLIAHYFLGTSQFYGDNSTDIMVGVPFKLLNPFLFVLFAFGLIGIVIKKYTERKYIFVLFMLLLTTVPILISNIFDGMWTTLSPYRMFYILVPAYILVAIGIKFSLRATPIRFHFLIYSLVFSTLIYQAYGSYNESKRFSAFLNGFDCRLTYATTVRNFNCDLPKKYKNSLVYSDHQDSNFRYLPISHGLRYYRNFLVPVLKYSQLLTQKYKQINEVDGNIILEAPLSDFKYDIVTTGPMVRHNFRKYHIALYLSENGINTNYFVPYPGKTPPSIIQRVASFLLVKMVNLKGTEAHMMSKIVSFPLYVDKITNDYVEQSHGLFWERVENIIELRKDKFLVQHLLKFARITGLFRDLKDNDNRHYFQIRSTGGKSNVFLVTTESEKKFVKELLSKNNQPVLTVKL
jgi:hypothetical protein